MLSSTLEIIQMPGPSLAASEAPRYKIAESRKVPVDLSSMRQCLAEGRAIFDCLSHLLGGSQAITLYNSGLGGTVRKMGWLLFLFHKKIHHLLG